METVHKANSFRGQAIGAAFFTGFGAIWLGLSLYTLSWLNATSSSLLAAGLAALSLSCFALYRNARRWPARVEDPRLARTYNRVNSAQWIAIFIVGFTFSRLHLDAYLLSAITAIVGIHLIPLAKLFRRDIHLVTGISLVLWASITVLFVPIEYMQGVTAFGTGLILWVSAAIGLASGILSARYSRAPLTRRQSSLST